MLKKYTKTFKMFTFPGSRKSTFSRKSNQMIINESNIKENFKIYQNLDNLPNISLFLGLIDILNVS